MDRGVWWATVQGVSKESDTTEVTLAHMYTGILSLQLKEAKRGEEKKIIPKVSCFYF